MTASPSPTRHKATAAAAPATARDRKTQLRAILGTGMGNAVEWYDWAIYATFASYISTQLFSKADPSSAFLSTLAIFAVGFVARPFGGFVFGWLGDRVGRKFSVTLCVGISSLGSLAIGLTPTFDSIGAGASVMLVTARLLQGLAHGGELPSAQAYLSEMAPASRRGYWSSLIYVSGTAGILFGTLLGAVLSTLLSDEQMHSFGWRLPFILGAVFGLIALMMRSRMEESEVFETQVNKIVPVAGASNAPAKVGIFTDIARNWRPALQIIGLTVGFTVVYWVWGVSTPAYAINVLGMDPSGALWAGVLANLVFIGVLPLWGKLSDRIGRKPVLLIGVLGSAVCFFPVTWLVQDSVWQLGVGMAVMLVFIGAIASIAPAVYPELFPASVRTIGVAIPYAIAVAAFGGTAAYLQAGLTLWFGDAGHNYFGIYAIVLLLVGASTVLTLRETRGIEL